MFVRMRTHLGPAGLIVAIVALVGALAGGAYAASGGLTGKQKKEVKSIAKSVLVPAAPGAVGPAGPTGPAGPAGPKGDTGSAGTDGAGVTSTSVAPGNPAKCEERGGAEFKTGTGAPSFACNGPEGTPGAPGSPWTAGGTLPVGATEKGTWTAFGSTSDAAGLFAPISFIVPLAASLDGAHVHYTGQADFATACTGTVNKPTAPTGQLCVYQGTVLNAKITAVSPPEGPEGASEAGAIVTIEPQGALSIVSGSWAVTG